MYSTQSFSSNGVNEKSQNKWQVEVTPHQLYSFGKKSGISIMPLQGGALGEEIRIPKRLVSECPTSLTFSPLRFLSFRRAPTRPSPRVLSHPLNPSARPCSEVTGFLVRKEANRQDVSARTNWRRHGNGYPAVPEAGAPGGYDSTRSPADVTCIYPAHVCTGCVCAPVHASPLRIYRGPVAIHRRSCRRCCP